MPTGGAHETEEPMQELAPLKKFRIPDMSQEQFQEERENPHEMQEPKGERREPLANGGE